MALLLERPASAECIPPRGRRPSTQDHRRAIFREAAAIVQAELAGPITADEVARRVASSPRQLRRAFSEIGGMSFRRFLTSARMARAAQLLVSTDMPVRDVARRVGYHEPSQFTKAFKRTHGMTPSELRARRSER